MTASNIRVAERSRHGHGPVVLVEGYLDENGGTVLHRRARAVSLEGGRDVLIDLSLVSLFTCSGVRLLITTVREMNRLGCDVDLVGVNPSLQRMLDLAA